MVARSADRPARNSNRGLRAQNIQARLLQRRIVVVVEIVQSDHMAAFGQQPAGNMKADEARRSRDQYRLIRHRHPLNDADWPARGSGASLPAAPRVPQYPVGRLLPDRPQNHTKAGKIQRAAARVRAFRPSPQTKPRTMRRILLSSLKILISAALLYLALRKVDFHELASRFNVASLGWIALAIAVTFLQIFVGVLRWREISAECGAPLGPRRRRAST